MTILIIITLICVSSFVAFCYMCSRAEYGYEDETGYHSGREVK